MRSLSTLRKNSLHSLPLEKALNHKEINTWFLSLQITNVGEDVEKGEPTRWTCISASSRSWWWTRKPGVPQPMGSQSQTQLREWAELYTIDGNLKECSQRAEHHGVSSKTKSRTATWSSWLYIQTEDVNLERHNMRSPVFTSVLFTVAEIRKQSMSTNRQMGKDVVYTLKCYSVIKMIEILPFATTCMDLEGIMLSEVRQRKTNHMILFICGI